MKRRAWIFQLAVLLVLGSPLNLYSANFFEDEIETPLGYTVRYTDDPAKAPHTCKPIWARWVADAVDRCHRVFVDDWRFLTPYWSEREGIIEVRYPSNHDDPSFDGAADLDEFVVNVTSSFESETDARTTTLHELFHHVQFAYEQHYEQKSYIGWPWWVIEGQASLMEDKTFPDLDNFAGGSYMLETYKYLNHGGSLMTLKYPACVFWTYFAERRGRAENFSSGSDFNVGAGELRQFLAVMASNTDPILSMNKLFANPFYKYEGDTTTFKSYFRDFQAALFAKDYLLVSPLYQMRYGFIDETIAQSKAKPLEEILSHPFLDGLGLVPWSGYRINFTIDTPGAIYGLKAKSNNNKPFAVSLMPIGGVTPGGSVQQVVHRYGTEIAVAFYNFPSDPVSHFGACFTTFEDEADLSYIAVSGNATLSLTSPTASHPAYVGNAPTRRSILARVRVGGPPELGTPSVTGLTKLNFTAEIGGVPGIVTRCARVRGDYWLVITPPLDRPGTGELYTLRVRCLGDSAEQEGAVIYKGLIQSQVIVIDRSGSMSLEGRLDAAKAAASIMVNAAPNGDKVGLVAFHGFSSFIPYDDADLLYPLTALDYSYDYRTEIIRSINGIGLGAGTSIGDGLGKAQLELDAHAYADLPKVITLLSDGEENTPLYWADVKDDIIAKKTKIHAVALGDEGNAKMASIAQETGGEYYYVPIDPGWITRKARPRSTGYLPQSLAVRLADTFLQIEDRIQDRVRLWSAADSVAPGGTAEFPIRLREGAITQAVLSAVWANAETSFTMRVYDPDGTWITNGTPEVDIYQDATHEVYQFGTMASGSWSVVVQSLGTATSEFQAALSGRGNLVRMDVWLDGSTNLAHRLAGEPIGMRALLSDATGPLVDAEVAVTVRHPDGTTNRFRLRDDGMHGDDDDGDGTYEFPYARTTQTGSYLFLFQAQGQTSAGAAFSREQTLAAYVTCNPENGGDADSDGMADPWELLHDLDPDSDDGAYDFDGDGLSNLAEFMAGCDPHNSDTDGGGIVDGSEVVLDRDPLEELDDDVARPSWGEVVIPRGCTAAAYSNLVQTNALLIRFPVCPTYRFVHLYRSTLAYPVESFVRVKKLDVHAYPGLYLDQDLTNDQPYYYYLVAEGTNEQFTAPSPVFSGIPKADPVPPGGWVKINGGAPRTSSLDVTLTFNPLSDATEMMVSEDGSFTNDTWIPKVDSMPWTLTPKDTDPPLGIVYAKFRRGPSNNESDVGGAAIAYDPDADADDDGLADDIDVDDDNDGIPDDVESANYLDPNRPDSDGDGIPDAGEDLDNDGQTTRDELSGGSGPSDPDSRFEVLRIAMADGLCQVAAPHAAGRNIRLQMAGQGLGDGESWSNAPLAGSVVGAELRWEAAPGGSNSFYRVAADPYLSADFGAIGQDDIAQAAVSGEPFSGDDEDNQLTPGTILLCHTSSGRFTKFLIESWGYDLGLRWTTYDADGSLYSSGTDLLIRGTFACDLDEGSETDADCDFRWDQYTGTERSLTPQNGARFLKIH